MEMDFSSPFFNAKQHQPKFQVNLSTNHHYLISMNRRFILSFTLILFFIPSFAQWKPVGDNIASKWRDKVNPDNAWKEYPRPQLVRSEWKNINGLWDYTILPKGKPMPDSWDGKILVPYCVESSLSGVGKALNPDQELWYNLEVKIPDGWKGRYIKLHFGAVDYKTTVYVNDQLAGEHTGSSDPFSFDITPFLKEGVQKINVKVWDPTDSDIQPRGKQALNPFGFWYTAVSGIWQTVWLEPVSETNINHLEPVADLASQTINLRSVLENPQGNEMVKVKISFKGNTVKEEELRYSSNIKLKLDNPKLWDPTTPNLYDLEMEVKRGDLVVDKFNSYFAMREVSLRKDVNGFTKINLNNKPLFQWGVLDQGWWPESLLTPPTDDALKYDMEVLKDLGFNMIRKHIKVEPARFYYHADVMGLLVWQDMPSGFLKINHPEQHLKWDDKEDWKRPEASAKDFEKEWKSIMDNLRFFPSIVVWVPFNEGWGQYDTKRIAEWTRTYDPTRLTNATSGWTDRGVGAMYDAHQYPGPSMEPAVQNPGRAIVLGEFGGLGWPIKGHLWKEDKKNWGYRTYEDEKKYVNEYSSVIKNVYPLLSRGLSAAIYTQTTDVELEVNGLMTYDRKILKVPAKEVKDLHQKLYSNYGKAVFLVEDSEVSPSKIQFRTTFPGTEWYRKGNPAGFKTQMGPVRIAKGQSIWSAATFQLKDKADLAMKLYAQGALKIFLNGHLIYDKKILTKRHYDEFNLSEFKEHLKEGNNRIALELTDVGADSSFDYGLYQFNTY